jgi:hypothetical protein
MAQVVEHLTTKCKALCPNPSTAKNPKTTTTTTQEESKKPKAVYQPGLHYGFLQKLNFLFIVLHLKFANCKTESCTTGI